MALVLLVLILMALLVLQAMRVMMMWALYRMLVLQAQEAFLDLQYDEDSAVHNKAYYL